MVVYEIIANVDGSISAEFERYMVSQHIPDLIATGCFTAAAILRAGDTLQIRYTAADRQSLDGYLAEHADRLRADVVQRFPSGFQLSRQIWDVIEEFQSK